MKNIIYILKLHLTCKIISSTYCRRRQIKFQIKQKYISVPKNTFVNEELEDVEFNVCTFFIFIAGHSDEEYLFLLDTMDNGDKWIFLTSLLFPTSTMVKTHFVTLLCLFELFFYDTRFRKRCTI